MIRKARSVEGSRNGTLHTGTIGTSPYTVSFFALTLERTELAIPKA